MTSKHDQQPVHKVGKRGQALKLHREFVLEAILRTARGEKYVFAPGVRISFGCGCSASDKAFISNLLNKKGQK